MRSACRAVGFEPDIRFSSNEFGVILAAVAGAGAVALLPELGFADAPASVDVLTVMDVPTRRLVFGARRRGDPVRPNVGLVLDRLEMAAKGWHEPDRHHRGAAPLPVGPS
jgi:DNA-binding transcriptional LysR family regulator